MTWRRRQGMARGPLLSTLCIRCCVLMHKLLYGANCKGYTKQPFVPYGTLHSDRIQDIMLKMLRFSSKTSVLDAISRESYSSVLSRIVCKKPFLYKISVIQIKRDKI